MRVTEELELNDRKVTRIGGEEVTEYSGVEYVTSTVDFEVVF